MLTAYFLAQISTWAQTHPSVRGTWRLARWAVHAQLRAAQQIGVGVELSGPIFILNHGFIDIGNYVEIRSSWHRPAALCVVNPQGRLLIEDHVFINWGVTIGVLSQVTIGAYAQIGDECIIYDTDWHPIDGTDQNVPSAPTRIGRGVWIGARTVVLKGVSVGDNTVIGANSTVTHDLPANVLAAGTPARVLRSIQRTRYDQEAESENAQ